MSQSKKRKEKEKERFANHGTTNHLTTHLTIHSHQETTQAQPQEQTFLTYAAMSFSMLYFSRACVAQSTASCCMSSDMSAFFTTALRSDMVSVCCFVFESEKGGGGERREERGERGQRGRERARKQQGSSKK